MAPVFLFVLSSSFFGKRIKYRQRASLDKIASVHSFLKEALSTIPLIKVFGLER
jgi:ABC-type multidrug transport system fused ATPase/permease subunit